MNSLIPALSSLVDFLEKLSPTVVIVLVILAILSVASALCLTRISLAQGRSNRALTIAARAFRAKLGKMPALIMSLRDHLYVPDEVFKVAIALYSDAVLRDYEDPYSLLEANSRIQHEIQFILQVANKHHKVNLDGNFLYVRDFLIQYETELRTALRDLAAATAIRNKMVQWKNYFLMGLPFPPYTQIPEIPAT